MVSSSKEYSMEMGGQVTTMEKSDIYYLRQVIKVDIISDKSC